MKRLLMITSAVGFSLGFGLAWGAQHPGLAPAAISALQWSAMEIDGRVQSLMGNRVRVMVNCTSVVPPSTVVCTLFPLEAGDQIATKRAARVVQYVFAQYERERGYDWLELSLREPEPIPEALRVELAIVGGE